MLVLFRAMWEYKLVMFKGRIYRADLETVGLPLVTRLRRHRRGPWIIPYESDGSLLPEFWSLPRISD